MTVQQSPAIEHLDVLIIGAGLSGIGAAYYLQRDLPGKRYAILEGRAASGGTWDLFRYPGIRSDSDLYTFGYEFKPWVADEAIADAGQILDYLRETARENGIDRHIRYQHKVISADWSSQTARWTLTIERQDTGEQQRMTCTWLFSAAGYYRYDEGFTPRFEGIEQYAGLVIHPQHWPEDLDYNGKRVLVIGSGATAVTLVPAMTAKAAHVTMLQRTPSYVMNIPQKDPIALLLRRLLPAKKAHELTRHKNILLTRGIWLLCQKYPRFARRLIRFFNRRDLPEGYPLDEHFNPPYNPWDQRLCAVPDGDLFKCLSEGTADIVTDRIRTFTPRGVALESGKELEGGHRHHRHRPQHPTVRRHAPGGGRRTGGLLPQGRLQGHDARRHPQPRLRHRLHQRLLDPQGRPAVRALLPPAGVHGQPRPRLLLPATAQPRHAHPPAARLRRRLRPARPADAAPARYGRALADVDELPRRRQGVAPRPGARPQSALRPGRRRRATNRYHHAAVGHGLTPRRHPPLLARTTTMKNFANKVVVITGAGSGMGRAYALEFARLGAGSHSTTTTPRGSRKP